MVRAPPRQSVPGAAPVRVLRPAPARELLPRARLLRTDGRRSVHGRRHAAARSEPRRLRCVRPRPQPDGRLDRPRGDGVAGPRGVPATRGGVDRLPRGRLRRPVPHRLPPLRRRGGSGEVLPLGQGPALRGMRRRTGSVSRLPAGRRSSPHRLRDRLLAVRRVERTPRSGERRTVRCVFGTGRDPGSGAPRSLRVPALRPLESVSPPRRAAARPPDVRHRVLPPESSRGASRPVLQEAGRA